MCNIKFIINLSAFHYRHTNLNGSFILLHVSISASQSIKLSLKPFIIYFPCLFWLQFSMSAWPTFRFFRTRRKKEFNVLKRQMPSTCDKFIIIICSKIRFFFKITQLFGSQHTVVITNQLMALFLSFFGSVLCG